MISKWFWIWSALVDIGTSLPLLCFQESDILYQLQHCNRTYQMSLNVVPILTIFGKSWSPEFPSVFSFKEWLASAELPTSVEPVISVVLLNNDIFFGCTSWLRELFEATAGSPFLTFNFLISGFSVIADDAERLRPTSAQLQIHTLLAL